MRAGKFWENKKVFITGHTGFKGGWLALVLSHLGAKVHGYSLAPPSAPSFFEVTKLKEILASHFEGDIRNLEALTESVLKVQPEIVFHLAAQALVLQSYEEPIGTYSTNIMGTVHLFEALRRCPSVKAIVNVTSDKCYENYENQKIHSETDPMGGSDPYSSSKACSELITTSYRRSFFSKVHVNLASARAGNVIGGGDWARDRLIPDFFRTVGKNEPLLIRFPDAVRPWQHVIEPVFGYLKLAEKLCAEGETFSEAWNFGPSNQNEKPVHELLNYLQKKVSGTSWQPQTNVEKYEAPSLKLDSSKTKLRLGWEACWSLSQALDKTVEFYHAFSKGTDMRTLALKQIVEYERSMK